MGAAFRPFSSPKVPFLLLLSSDPAPTQGRRRRSCHEPETLISGVLAGKWGAVPGDGVWPRASGPLLGCPPGFHLVSSLWHRATRV